MNIIIRIAEEEDFSLIFEMVKEFASYLNKADKVQVTVDEMLRSKDYFQCFIAETTDGEPVGYVCFSYNYHTWSGKSIYIDDLFVKEEFRGKDIGIKLINTVFKQARETACRSVRWEVLDWNEKAIAFYKKIGATVGDNNLNCSFII